MVHIPYNPKLKKRAQKMRKNPTLAEKVFWKELLSEDKTGFRFLRQKPIDQYIVDFYCSELKLIIEIDGSIHEKQKKYDKIRTQILENGYNLTVLRFTNEEVLKDFKKTKNKLNNQIIKKVPLIKGI